MENCKGGLHIRPRGVEDAAPLPGGRHRLPGGVKTPPYDSPFTGAM